MGFILRCLKDCLEHKHEQLNLDMNSFLLLKNELSLAFLRNQDNIVATVKSAIKLYATQEEHNRRDLEQQELQILDKILKSQSDLSAVNGMPDQEPIGKAGEPGVYEKIIAKLLEYNEKVNEGKEISVVEYLKRIDMDSSFAKTFEIQRHIKRAFFEEFKIHSLNYVLLLFESVMRILTTVHQNADPDKDSKGKPEKMQYYSKNYRKFIENRQKKLDKFIVNCIGWNHINRCIEVIDMALRDLLYKIVPTKIVIRELKTSSGKVLTRDSEYTLVERKRYVTVGKKTHVDYIFELDLKEDTAKLSAQQEAKALEEEKKRQNVFYLNFEDFSMMKLRSAVFMLYFPVTFTISILNVWIKIIPNPNQEKAEGEELTKEEVDGINQAKHAIKDFMSSLCQHLRSLHDYLQQVIKEKPLQSNFNLIRQSPEFKAFKDVFLKTKHTGMTTVAAEEHFLQTYEKIEDSWIHSVEQVAKNIIVRVNDIQMDLMKKL
uniref:Uncharacterized protein n=1 Tax=Strombidium inclinatum TaxID=197538 RepID=A0A7S3N2T6_9SPIT|mmetsp:Transcript_5018/g.7529  ORF Transcript_5018/g.7529 Transcript_5018/m.7529 type:complete len:488 (+) Transcript_5018:2290-3753(+)